MSEYESLREDIGLIADSMGNYARTVNDHAAHANRQIKKLWEDNAELRDELVAVSNRLENLTRSIVTAPAEVAQRGFIRLAADLKDEPSPSKWHECSECGVDIRRGASDGLIYDAAGLHTCKVTA